MFSRTITDSSRFLKMPATSRLLYYDLGMNADDDGYAEWFTVMRISGSSEQDIRVLEANGFVKIFDDNVLIISDWKENNYIQKDRYKASKYISVYKSDTKCIQSVYKKDTDCTQNGYSGKVRLGKVRVRLGKSKRGGVGESVACATTQTIEEKTKKFIEEVKRSMEGVTLSKLQVEELKSFVSYWTEPNTSKTKIRHELQKTWDTKRRIGTWMRNKNIFRKSNSQKINDYDPSRDYESAE